MNELLPVRPSGQTAPSAIGKLLRRARRKGIEHEVATYLTGAMLMLRLEIAIPVHSASKDRPTRYQLENTVIEVAVGLPDEKHLDQIAEILDACHHEVWLLTRADRVATWTSEVENYEGMERPRVVIASVENFVGQNICEMGQFSAKEQREQLRKLVDLYNERWIVKVGTPGMKIQLR